MKDSIRTGTDLSLLCFNLDAFHAFRRQYGYELGDQVLRHVEKVASDVLSPIHIQRSEDDHFVAVVGLSPDETLARAERFRMRVGSSKLRFTVDGSQVSHAVTISVGISTNSPPPAHTNDFCFQATAAWASARESGDSVQVFTDPTAEEQAKPVDILASVVASAGSNASVSIIQFDIDGFEFRNNEVGHSRGDEILGALTLALKERFQPPAQVNRVWSDEYWVVLPETRAEDAAYLAEDARRHMAAMNLPGGEISMSVGVATLPRHAGDVGELIRKAREARFVSRQDGGGKTSVAEGDQMVTKTSHFSRTQLRRLALLAKGQDRSEAAILREGLDLLLQTYLDGAPNNSVIRHPFE